jgi:SAM-dependent methyltransferase
MMKVLQKRSQIEQSRQRLDQLKASSLEPRWSRILRRLGLARSIPVGDWLKSWDVNLTIEFLLDNLSKHNAILDIGAYASEMPVALHKLGFTQLAGADLNPRLKRMPFNKQIRYEIANFMETPFADTSFEAITSISVIEHGFDGERLLAEISRLLKPGGYFIASFDYWPQKIDTTGITFFDLDWLIFSQSDIDDFLSMANRYGLTPVGKMNYDADETPIE